MNTRERMAPVLAGVLGLLGYGGSLAGAQDAWRIMTVDSAGDVGRYSSVAILPSGQPCISYYDASSGSLKYAEYDGDIWQKTVVDQGSFERWAGAYCSLAIRLTTGQPGISYTVTTDIAPSGELWYAERVLGVWQTERIYHAGVFSHTSLAFLGSRSPLVYPAISCYESYHTPSGGSLWFVRYDGSNWQWNLVDNSSGEDVGQYSSLAVPTIGPFANWPMISYYDDTYDRLKFAWRDPYLMWHVAVVFEGGVGEYTSLAILPAGQPAISYRDATNNTLKYAWHAEDEADLSTGWDCNDVHVGDPHSDTAVGAWTSLAILPSGQPAISYEIDPLVPRARMPASSLYYATYDGAAWDPNLVEFRRTLPDAPGAYASSLAILPSGLPVISYYYRSDGYVSYRDLRCAIGMRDPIGIGDFGNINPSPQPLDTHQLLAVVEVE